MICRMEFLFALKQYTLFFQLHFQSLLITILIQTSTKFFMNFVYSSYHIIYMVF